MSDTFDVSRQVAAVEKADAEKWWETHANLAQLAAWMADNHYAANILAHMIEKPWHYTAEFVLSNEEEA